MTEGATEEDRMKVREKVFELIKKRKMKVSSKTYSWDEMKWILKATRSFNKK